MRRRTGRLLFRNRIVILLLFGAVFFSSSLIYYNIYIAHDQVVTKETISQKNSKSLEMEISNENKQSQNKEDANEVITKKDSITSQVSYKVITFYYPWYGNIETNGEWLHWNHKILIDNGANYKPPDSIGANFYPLLGPYSSIDPKIIEAHMEQLVKARIGIICMSWWGQKNGDSQLKHIDGYTDDATALVMNFAEKYGIKVCFHHEPYDGRTAASVREDLKYVFEKYGKHPAFFRWKEQGNRPIFFVYDSYLTKASEWASILSPESSNTIRGTEIDSVMIALFVNTNDERLIVDGHFDGTYTYFAANGFTFGSTISNWNQISSWAKSNGKLFIPSVGPGYDDTRIRPWNAQNKRERREGQYYDEEWKTAIDIDPSMISITSFNEWHEGTQIEPAIPKSIQDFIYSDYQPLPNDYYLTRTKYFVDKFDKLS